MRESKFVEQNQDKWADFESHLKDKKKDPHRLRAQLVEITDDLSYSRTFYKNRSVRIYLNSLAQQVYNNIYKNKKNFLKSLNGFFREDVPRIVYNSRREMLVSFLLLILTVAIGMFSSAREEGFARSILGDAYVEKTLENIRDGKPLGIYAGQGQVDMFFYIAINNLRVGLIVFILGLLASYGSVVIMVINGIMLGTFMHFFYSRGLTTEFNLTVWMHGTIEILTMVVETVAGMLLGRGLVYPGTLSRMKAFSVWGRRGAMLFLATVPFIIFAAFVESFLTRYTDMPNIIRALFILLCLGLMVFYFVLYPYRKFRNTTDVDLGMPELKPETSIDFKPDVIYSNGNIFLKTIQLFGMRFSSIIRNVLLISLVYLGLMVLVNMDNTIQRFQLLQIDISEFMLTVLSGGIAKFIAMYGNVSLLFNHDEQFSMYFISSIWIAIVAWMSLVIVSKKFPFLSFDKWKAILGALVMSFALNTLMLSDNGFVTLLYIVLSPLFVLLLANSAFTINGRNFISSIGDYAGHGFSRMIGVLFLFMVVTFFGMVFILSPFAYLAISMMDISIDLPEETYTLILKLVMMFAFIFLVTFSMVFYIVQCIYLAFSVNEISGAGGLLKGIENIGESKKAYGVETE